MIAYNSRRGKTISFKFCVVAFSFLYLAFIFPSAAFAEDVLILFKEKDNSYFVSQELTFDSADYDTLVLDLKAPHNALARIYWATSYDPQFNTPKSIWFRLGAGEHRYYFNIPSQNSTWLGWIKGFILFPETEIKLVEIKTARLIKGNLFTGLASALKEFGGPNGRVVTGSVINVTPASAIFGRSINIYCYWLAGFFFLAAFGYFFTRNKNLGQAANQSKSSAFMFIIALWLLLALNTNYNYANIFKDTCRKNFGKTMDEKRAAAYGKDFYYFLKFAKEKLPLKPQNISVLSSTFAPDLQARIYLIPHVYLPPDKDIDFLLVFRPKPDQFHDKNKFTIFAKLNENEYILKRAR